MSHSRFFAPSLALAPLFSLLALGGCTGAIGSGSSGPGDEPSGPATTDQPGAMNPSVAPGGSPGSRGDTTPGNTNGGMTDDRGSSSSPTPGSQPAVCGNPQLRGTANNSTRRLTKPQLVNTLKDLLGATVMADDAIKVALSSLPSDLIKTKANELPADPAAQLADTLFTVASRASELALASAPDIFGSCAKQSPVTDACATTFIQSFGLRVYRRPLTANEVQTLMATHTRVGGGQKGLQAVLARLLQSPSMVFLLEGGGTPTGGRIRLTDYQVAARISYLLADTTPDAALLAAAGKGELGSLDSVRSHAERLMATPTARAKMAAFFGFYLQTDTQGDPFASAAKLDGVATTNLASEMRKEVSDYIDYQLFTKRGSLKDLLTSDAAFPRSANLAKVLETAVASGTEPSRTSTAHAGLLLRPLVLSGVGDRTPAMHRGNIVRSQVLCDIMPPPPPAAAAAIAAAAGTVKTTSNREHLTKLTMDGGAMCMACHSLINPLAFAFEGYDQLGRPRTIETTYDSKGNPSTTFPIDTVVKDPMIEDGGPTALNGALDLVSAVAATTKARTCIALTAFQYYRLRERADADGCALADMYPAAADGASLADLFVRNVANEDIFWKGN